jgi:hypothetical protein
MSSMLMLDASTLTSTSRLRGAGSVTSIISIVSASVPGRGRRVNASARIANIHTSSLEPLHRRRGGNAVSFAVYCNHNPGAGAAPRIRAAPDTRLFLTRS